jgi:HEAT repeat protein
LKLAAALALGALLCGCGPGEVARADRGEPAEDPRLDWLLDSGGRDDHYDVDTSDTLGILSEVLRHGQRDPLRRARMELGQLGPEGVAAAQRVIEAAWNDPMRFADVRNALDALSYASDDAAHAVVARVLEHPDSSPRQAAWRALKPMARPSDYDRLRALLEIESSEFSVELAQLLFDADPERAVAEYLDWIEQERFPGLWEDVSAAFPKTRDPENARRACSLRHGREPILALQLAGACLPVDDGGALAFLREQQRSELGGARELALNVLIQAGRVEELAWSFEHDAEPALRQLAASVIAKDWPPERAEPLLRAGMQDPDWGVSWGCLNALVARGDAEAIERAVDRLGSEEPGVLENAILALRPRMLGDAALAERVRAVLVRRADEEAWLDPESRRAVLRALGLTPSRGAAEYLIARSREIDGRLQGLDAERWTIQQVGNGGPPGQQVLVEELARETELHRRLDLIEALAATPTHESETWLFERAAAEDVDPWELLFVAERLTRLGPTARVAPLLKRSVLRVDQPDVRRALQALLWTWYPAPAR